MGVPSAPGDSNMTLTGTCIRGRGGSALVGHLLTTAEPVEG